VIGGSPGGLNFSTTRYSPSSVLNQECSVMRLRFRARSGGVNEPRSANYGRKQSMIVHGMVRRRRR
jgi:hypothetical protein